VSAFANTFGGKLLYGVGDDGELVGLADAERDAEDLSEIIKSSLDPVPAFKLEFVREDNKTFMVVSIHAGDEAPYYVFLKGHRDAYVRVGNESVKASSIDLKRLVLKGEKRSWDSLPSSFNKENFSFEKLRAVYFNRVKATFVESDFESFGLVANGGSLTNAGALLADGSPVRHSRVFCTRWNGLTKSNGTMEALDDDEFTGGLLSLLDSALGFIKVNTKTRWRKLPDGGGRVEYPEYPTRAIEEAITNALIHRDYLEIGSEVHIDMFDDRMEVYSPGGMPSGEIVQEIDTRRVASVRRNPVIADLFQRLDLMERRGSGFGKILDAYVLESEKRGRDVVPRFQSGTSNFYVILPNLNYGVEVVPNGAQTRRADDMSTEGASLVYLTKMQKIAVRAISADASITIKDLQKKTKLSSASVSRLLLGLKRRQIIRRVGPDKGGHWEVLTSKRGDGE